MDGKRGPTIQTNTITIILNPKFNETKISLWLVPARLRSRCQRLRTKRSRKRKFIRVPRSRGNPMVTTTIIITRTEERRKPRLLGLIRFENILRYHFSMYMHLRFAYSLASLKQLSLLPRLRLWLPSQRRRHSLGLSSYQLALRGVQSR
jgi:hypothetical protein